MQRKLRTKLVLLDRLTRTMQDDKVSKWQGESMGWWVIERAETRAVGKPIARLYLNRQFLSGVFVTRDPKAYSADMKEADRRRYLVLKSTGADKMEVWERVPDTPAQGAAIAPGSAA